MKCFGIQQSVCEGVCKHLKSQFIAAPGSQHLSLLESDSDDDEDIGRVRSDGTLLASDPPKPL